MSEDNKISVIINTYNAEQHLRKVLDSVKDFDEVVVCDMESTDHTLEIAKEYPAASLPGLLPFRVPRTNGPLWWMPTRL